MPILDLKLLQQEIEYASLNQDFLGAFEVYNLVKEWLEKSDLRRGNKGAYSQYFDYLQKLKFISLNYFEQPEDYIDLLKNHFHLIFEIPNDFDLWGKLEVYLVSLSNLDERNEIKSKLKAALESSVSNLLKRSDYPDNFPLLKVGDWVKNFVANLGFGPFDKVKKIEYLSNDVNIRALKEEDKEKVRILMDIYEKLLLPSDVKEGYENTVLFSVDNKTMIFNRGEVEEIKPFGKIEGREDENKDKDKDVVVTQVLGDSSAGLQAALDNYSPSSLEYKAIKQEIERLRKTKNNVT
jgi:hypothetical protein